MGEEDIAILVGARSTLLVYFILLANYLTTKYCPKEIVNDFVLRRMFYSKQGFRDTYYFLA